MQTKFINTNIMTNMNKLKTILLKTLLSAVVMTAALDAGAQKKAGQFSFTPKAGMTVSGFSGSMPLALSYNYNPERGVSYYQLEQLGDDGPHLSSVAFGGKKSKVGFTIGVESEYQFTPVFGLSLGILYTREGAVYETKGTYPPQAIPQGIQSATWTFNDNMKVDLNCITLPLLANVYVWKGLSLEAGLQPEFAIEKKIKGDMSVSYKSETTQTKSVKAELKGFSLSLPVGASYEYRGVELGVRYHFGLTNISKIKDSARNRLLMLTLGYRFTL